jgi:hypothetical protein
MALGGSKRPVQRDPGIEFVPSRPYNPMGDSYQNTVPIGFSFQSLTFIDVQTSRHFQIGLMIKQSLFAQ